MTATSLAATMHPLASGFSGGSVLCLSNKLWGHGIIPLCLHDDPFVVKVHLASGKSAFGPEGCSPSDAVKRAAARNMPGRSKLVVPTLCKGTPHSAAMERLLAGSAGPPAEPSASLLLETWAWAWPEAADAFQHL